jgi:hypothetical protein
MFGDEIRRGLAAKLVPFDHQPRARRQGRLAEVALFGLLAILEVAHEIGLVTVRQINRWFGLHALAAFDNRRRRLENLGDGVQYIEVPRVIAAYKK